MTALSSLSVDDLVDTATARLSEAEDALRELAKRDPDGNTFLGYGAAGEARRLPSLIQALKALRKRDRQVETFTVRAGGAP